MIRLHELTKSFHSSGRTVRAVNELSLVVNPGEVYGLLGPNGAGKTTTLRMILGLLVPDSGFAEVDGFRTLDEPMEVRARIGMVAASDGVYPWLTVREMLLFFADLYGVDQQTAKANVDRMAERFNMTSYLDRRASTLSTGQRQRAILTRGLVHDPPVIMLDEPTRGMDVIGSQVVFDYIGMLRDSGKAVIVSTHRLDEAERLCDRFGLLNQGQLGYEGTLNELRERSGRDSLVEIFGDMIRGVEDTVISEA
ncbi:MAG: ATP-binding cassette domain-containing protein [Planctomycetota bacterium]